MNLIELLCIGIEKNASDVHLTVGLPPTFRIDGQLVSLIENKLTPDDTLDLVKQALDEKRLNKLNEDGEIDFSYSIPTVGRFRVNVFKQRGTHAMVLRIIPLKIPLMDELGIPHVVNELSKLPRGLILVTGPTGSGKTTTLASIINKINSERRCHIITLEDPLEYLHKHKKSIVNQREVGSDTLSFANGLRGALREDPDVILVGEMRDLETISIAITAAETGHLVLSTLHTNGAAKTIDRIVDVFPPYQQQQIRVQLSAVIEAVISQQLLPKASGSGRIAAHEVMLATPAIRNLIREGKNHQIDTSIQTSGALGMQTMDTSLINLYKRGLITKVTAISQAYNMDAVKKKI
ncbi:twitching motility protein PilT [Sedimentibacter acidaminivorans]|jgi:twitching motility protein PilT|uniref:Twitching motility protein PilT n=1 Tax=Sedimentibacter acidaminivorans TaxID=913099 RepID=A0ABS4GI12_9FIRM|nr:type IV pilus twitching motility protein PilT [Sedimentibacter acidaminivorans]MBP1927338.1 twitching motility protein PilT [Sedimentibacter acidaminivorans]